MRSTASSANAFLLCGNAPHRANWPTGAAICRAAAVGRILESDILDGCVGYKYPTYGLLPDDIDYSKVKGLSAEVQQKLNQHKPETVGQASRISGVTPAAVALLMVHLKRGFKGAK